MLHFSSREISSETAYKLLVSIVAPRPIAFVTSMDLDGNLNGAPFSFFNTMGSSPPVIVLGFQPNVEGNQKDTPNNILSTEEFVVNIVDEPLAQQMNICASSQPPEVNEIELAKLDTISSLGVAPPRIKASPASMECKLMETVSLSGGGKIIIGEVIHFHLRDDAVSQINPLRIDINKLAPISRLNGPLYGRITDQLTIDRL